MIYSYVDGFSETFYGSILAHTLLALISYGFLAFSIIDLVINLVFEKEICLHLLSKFPQNSLFSSEFFILVTFGFLMTMLNWIPCYIGKEIEANGQKISRKLYESSWTSFDAKNQTNVIVMLTILQVKPIRVQIGQILPLNFETFLKLVNVAYSMIAFLRNL